MFSKILDVLHSICKVTLKVFEVIALRNKENEKATRINKYNDIVDSVFVDPTTSNRSDTSGSNDSNDGVDTK